MVLSVVPQGIEVVPGGVGVHRGLQRIYTGAGDSRGGEALVGPGVVGGVGVEVHLGAAGGVEDGGIDVQIARRLAGGVVQAVVDDRGNLGLVGAVGLLLDHGGHGHHVLDGAAVVLYLLAHLVGEDLVKAEDHLVEHAHRFLAHIELVGVGEQVALQPLGVAQGHYALEEGELEVVIGCGLLQLLHRGHPLLLQKGEDLGLCHALGYGDGGGHAVGGGGAHAGDEGPVVHVGVQLIGARGDLGPLLSGLAGGVGQGTEELKHHLVLDEALLLQLVGHLAHRVPLVDLHHGGKGGLVEGQHIVGPDPAHAGQEGGDAKHKNDIEQHTPAAETLFPAAGGGAAFSLRVGGGDPPAAVAAPRLGRPAALIPVFFLRHRFNS